MIEESWRIPAATGTRRSALHTDVRCSIVLPTIIVMNARPSRTAPDDDGDDDNDDDGINDVAVDGPIIVLVSAVPATITTTLSPIEIHIGVHAASRAGANQIPDNA